MIKSQLIEKISAELTELSEKQINEAVNCIIDLMSSALLNNQRIEIRRFGSFSLRYRPARNAHNPKTGEKVVTTPKYIPHFKPGKELRERINQAKTKVTLQDTEE